MARSRQAKDPAVSAIPSQKTCAYYCSQRRASDQVGIASCHEKDDCWAKEGIRRGKAEANKQSAAKRDLGCNNAIALLALAFLPLH